MKAAVAFDVCHEIYAAARELVDSRLPTMQLDAASKFLWRPDRRPRLVEYVADFALAGERALTGMARRHPHTGVRTAPRSPRSPRCAGYCTNGVARAVGDPDGPESRAVTGDSACPRCQACGIACAAPGALRASRLILFRMYYLGGAEYQATRRMLGISELTWSDWTDEIRTRIGRELVRSGMFPPSRYFRQHTKK
jgi:hypothetical protein